MSEFLGRNLIFLISLPRSGSTLLQHLLAGHRDIVVPNETWLMLHQVYALRNEGLTAEYGANLAREALEDYLDDFCGGREVFDSAIRAWAQKMYGCVLEQRGAKFILDKTPRYCLILEDLQRIFPEAKFIYLVRNPLAILNSIIKTWVRDWRWFSGYRLDLTVSPKNMCSAISGNDGWPLIRYEDLVQTPDEVLSKLAVSLGVAASEFESSYDHVGRIPGRHGDPTGVAQHTQPVKTSLESWKSLGQSRQSLHLATEFLQSMSSDQWALWGYDREQLLSELGAFSPPDDGIAVLPWEQLLRPMDSWTRSENLAYLKCKCLRKYGHWNGRFQYFRRYYRSVIAEWMS